MASLKTIRKRIGSVKNTQQITKAMKMVAAAKLRRAQEAAQAARPYAEKLAELLRAAEGHCPRPAWLRTAARMAEARGENERALFSQQALPTGQAGSRQRRPDLVERGQPA